jgi:hypothetical protein
MHRMFKFLKSRTPYDDTARSAYEFEQARALIQQVQSVGRGGVGVCSAILAPQPDLVDWLMLRARLRHGKGTANKALGNTIRRVSPGIDSMVDAVSRLFSSA